MQEKKLQVNWDQKLLLAIYTLKSLCGHTNFKRFLLTTQTASSLSVSSLVRYGGTSFQGTPSGPRLAWDQALQWEERQKTRLNKKNIGQRSEPSGGLGRGKAALPSPDYLSARFASRFFFSPNAEPGPRLNPRKCPLNRGVS